MVRRFSDPREITASTTPASGSSVMWQPSTLLTSVQPPHIAAVPVDRVAGGSDGCHPQFRKVVKGLPASFATDSALAKATPRSGGVEAVVVVHPHHSVEKLCRHPMGARNIPSPDRGTETIGRVVGLRDGVAFPFERSDCHHGPEELSSRTSGRVVHANQNRRFHVKAIGAR